MHTKILVALSPFAILIGGPAAAQTEPEIVVTAPAGLTEKEQREWDKINRDAEKLASRMAKLRTEAEDEASDVAKAERDVERAEKKLRDKRRDMEKTQRDIARAERDMQKLEERRAKLRGEAR